MQLLKYQRLLSSILWLHTMPLISLVWSILKAARRMLLNELTWIKEHCCMWRGMLEQGVRRCRTPVLHPRRTSSPCPRRGLFSSHHESTRQRNMHILKHIHFLLTSGHTNLAFYLMNVTTQTGFQTVKPATKCSSEVSTQEYILHY